MMTRFFRLVWVLSVLWFGFVAVGMFNAANGLAAFGVFFVLGWPALIGLFISYIGSGSFLFPKHIE